MKRTFLLLSLSLAATGVSARQITESEARAIASERLVSTGTPQRIRANTAAQNADVAPLYMFNARNGGFAIVAGDDRMPNMILAYSDNAVVDLDNCPPAMLAWLDEMSAFIEAGDFSTVRALDLDFSEAVAPLVATQWNQTAPFNLLTPLSDGDHCPAGCAATAMAQILKYWVYPTEGGLCEHSYEWKGVTYSVDFRESIYDWANMANTYTQNVDDTENVSNMAVAKLMYDCGVSCNMQYSPLASGAYTSDCAAAFVDIFGYSKSIHLQHRELLSDDEWFALLKDELDAARPLFFSGMTESNEGHAFVCDGYDTDGLFHINWGWGGYCDGYFDITALDPIGQGTGGAASGQGFSCNQAVITNICLPSEEDVADKGWEMAMDNFKLTLENEEATSFSIYFEIYNVGYKPYEGNLGIYFFKDDIDVFGLLRLNVNTYVGELAISPQCGKGFGYPPFDVAELGDGVWQLKFVAIPLGSDEEITLQAYRTSPEPKFVIEDGVVKTDSEEQEEGEGESTGIGNIATENISAVAEIYTLTGIRVNSEEALAPGLYIRREGAKSSKFIVR